MSRRRRWIAAAGLALATAALLLWQRAGGMDGPSAADVHLLREERNRLRTQLLAAAASRGLLNPPAAVRERGNAVVGLSRPFVEDVVGQAVAALFGDVGLRLENLEVHAARPVHARVLLVKNAKVGEYRLDLAIQEVTSRLAARAPQLEFGKDRIRVRLPVALAAGEGRGTLHFVWDGKGVAGLVCGDLDLTRELDGTIRPLDYLLEGNFELRVERGSLRAFPEFDELAVRIYVRPSDRSWAAVRKVLDDRKGVCGAVLDRVPVIEILEKLLARGFRVKLPRLVHRPFRIPAGFSESMEIGGHAACVTIVPGEVSVSETMLWYGAAIDVQRDSAAGAGSLTPAGVARGPGRPASSSARSAR